MLLPSKLKLENFFSHRASEVDFSQFSSALLIGSCDGDYNRSNGTGKCLGEHTVLTNPITGERITVKDLHNSGRTDFKVHGMNSDYTLSPTNVIGTAFSGKKDLLKITMDNGLFEIVSKTHPIFTATLGTQKAEDIIVGQYVAQPRKMNVAAPTNKINIARARILSLFMAEGSLTSNNVSFTNMDQEIIDIATEDLRNEFHARLTKDDICYSIASGIDKPEVRKAIWGRLLEIGIDLKKLFDNNYHRAQRYEHSLSYQKLIDIQDRQLTQLADKLNTKKCFVRFMEDCGVYNKKAIHKTMPQFMFSETEDVVAAFIGMFISCDGYISNMSKTPDREISICLGSEQLVRDFQSLFSRFGIMSSFHYKKASCAGKKFDSWRVSINTNKPNFERFFNLVNGHIVGPKAIRLGMMNKKIMSIAGNPNKDIIPSDIYGKEFSALKSSGFLSANDGFAKLCASQYISSNMSRDNFEKHSVHLKNDNYINLSRSDLLWAKVSSIEEIGMGDTYDIEIDNETKLYALDGFITHNSSLFEGILWCLYNKSRATTSDDVIMWGEEKCVVSLDFSHGGKEYNIKRTRFRSTSTSTVELFVIGDDGKPASLSGSTSGETNDKIVKLLKIDYKTFVNSTYFMQNDISEFATSEASKKKDILKSIVDLSKWDGFEKESKKRAKDIQTELIKFQARYDALKVEVEALSLSDGQLVLASESLAEKTKDKEALQERLDIVSENYLKLKNNIDTDSWDRATSDIVTLKSSGKDLKQRLDAVLPVLEKRLERKEAMSAKLVALEKKIRTLSFDAEIESKLDKVSAEWVEYSGAIQQAKIKLKELAAIVFHDEECYTCHQKMESEEFNKLTADHEANTDHYTKKKANSESRIAYLSSLKKELEQQRDDNLTIERSQAELKNISSQLIILEEEIVASETEKAEIYNKMLDTKQRIVDNERVLMSLKNESFQSLHDELKSLKKSMISISDEILQTGIKVGSLKEKTQSLSKKREELLSIKKTYDAKSAEMAIFDKMTKMFGKSGIQTLLLEAVIQDLESTSNRILSSICSEQFSIELATQRAGSDGISVVETLDLNVKKDGSLCGFSSLSGGEQFRIALSLRIALSELATRHGGSSLEFLLLDEINSPLDKSGVETLFVNVIKQLETKYKILVITHDDSLKERFDNVLDVSKVSGESTVAFSTNSAA